MQVGDNCVPKNVAAVKIFLCEIIPAFFNEILISVNITIQLRMLHA
jgi:hypothetical protein